MSLKINTMFSKNFIWGQNKRIVIFYEKISPFEIENWSRVLEII